MKKIILLSFFFLFLSEVFAQNGWVQVYSHPGLTLNRMFFLNENTGWICGDSGRVVKTTDKGITWSLQNAHTVHPLYDICFFNENTGWVVGGRQIYFNDIWRVSSKTTDGGATWITSTPSFSYDNNTRFVYFKNASTGIFMGAGSSGGSFTGDISRTTNGGANSTFELSNIQFNYFKAAENGVWWRAGLQWADFGYTSDSIKIQSSTNDGLTWETKSRFNGYYVSDYSIADENNFFLLIRSQSNVSSPKSLLLSTNAGANWSTVNLTPLAPYKINFINRTTGWASENGLYRTTSAGLTWQYQMAFSGTVFMRDSLRGFCFGKNGNIFITGTAGITSVENSSSQIPDKFSLSQNYPNPFNPSTKINYELPITNYVILKVYDALGNEVATLVNEKQNAGSYSVDFNASSLPSGIYFYKLITENFSETKKMILVK